jgi:hypothetical protein
METSIKGAKAPFFMSNTRRRRRPDLDRATFPRIVAEIPNELPSLLEPLR